jgi:hypothetical protein
VTTSFGDRDSEDVKTASRKDQFNWIDDSAILQSEARTTAIYFLLIGEAHWESLELPQCSYMDVRVRR